MTALATIPEVPTDLMNMIVGGGDLAKLTEEKRAQYLVALCKSVGLNPLSRPIQFTNIDGKIVPYASKDCTEQLRKIYNVTLKVVARESIAEVHMVTVIALMPDGRQDESIGTVFLGGLKGKDLANAYMRAETKAKRRVTLSICGLGFLDESEIDDVTPRHVATVLDPEPVAAIAAASVESEFESCRAAIAGSRTLGDLLAASATVSKNKVKLTASELATLTHLRGEVKAKISAADAPPMDRAPGSDDA